jgi:Ca2+-binding RTX toxin-like protein
MLLLQTGGANTFTSHAPLRKVLGMKRTTLLLVSITAALMLASGVVFAATISCPNQAGNLCVGTDNRDTMYGSSNREDMRGRGAADTLRARAGADRLTGGDGGDNLGGGVGSDIYAFGDGWGQDRITLRESSGVDTLDFTGVNRAHVQVELVADRRGEVYALGGSGTRTATINFPSEVILENVRGTPKADLIEGNDAPNHLWGYSGWPHDSLEGNAGNDVLDGGSRADWLFGEEGNDTLIGGPDHDLFDGGGGDDTIHALDGTRDRIRCGDGNDTVHYDQGLDFFLNVSGDSSPTPADASCETALTN